MQSKRQQPALLFGEQLLLSLAFIFLLFEVFNGALRYYFALADLGWLIYVPKMLVSTAVVVELMRSLYRLRIGPLIAAILIALAAFALVGTYYTKNPLQAAFGVYGMFPLLLGVMVLSAVEKMGSRLLPYVLLLWLCAAGGVFLDYLYEVPWQGFEYAVGGVEVTASRQWWTYGVDRLSGFSRASYEAAAQLLFLAIGVVWLARSRLLILAVWLLSGVLIALTTTKRTVGVYAVFTLLLPIIGQGMFFKSLRMYVGSAVPWVIAFIGIALPVSTLLVDYSLDLDDPVSLFLFASFEDRLTWAWPKVFELLREHGSLWIGRGIGGIGAAQSYFESELYTFTDNLYLHLYSLFGCLAALIVWSYVRSVSRLLDDSSRFASLTWSWAVAALMEGWAVNGVEGALTAMMLGITWAFAARPDAYRRVPLNPTPAALHGYALRPRA